MSDFLVDSGSTYTIVDREFFQGLPDCVQSRFVECDVALGSASGELLKVFGEVNLSLELRNKVFETSVKVVALGDKTTILGLDFMEQNDCILHMGRGYRRMGVHKVHLHHKGDTQCARIQVTETSCVPPDHEVIISAKFDYNHWVSLTEIGLVESTQSITSHTGLLVARSLMQTEKAVVPLRVANLTDKMITLSGGLTIVLLQPIDKVSSFLISKGQGSVLSMSSNETYKDQAALLDHLRLLMESLSNKLSAEQVRKFEELLIIKTFLLDLDGKLGSTTLTEHCIETGDHPPIKLRPRSSKGT